MTSRGVYPALGLLLALAAACTTYTSSSDDDETTSSSGAPGASTSGGGSGSSGTSASSGSSGSASSSGSVTSSSGSSGASTSSTSSASSSTSGGPLDAFEQTVLNGINDVRAGAQPTPSPALPPLYWDYEAAAACQTVTDECGASSPSGTVLGGGTSPFPPDQVVAFMRQEEALYDYEENQCDPGAELDCMIYKMMVQRSVNRVGCAISTCPGNEDVWACKFTVVSSFSPRPY